MSNNIMHKTCVLLIVVSIFGICIAHKERVFGGGDVNIEYFPYQVSMRSTQWGTSRPWHICGGAIISKNHIITGAHCVYEKRSPSILPHIKIYTGTSSLDYGGNVYNVKNITIHPWYRGASTGYLYDIAIVTVQGSIEFNKFQKPIKLPNKYVQTGQIAAVAGWGSIDDTGKVPVNLQMAWMYILTKSTCQKRLRYPLQNSQFCAIRSKGIGICYGDSGSPLVFEGVLVGIVARVFGCGVGNPDVYTNVYYFINFIKGVMNSGLH